MRLSNTICLRLRLRYATVISIANILIFFPPPPFFSSPHPLPDFRLRYVKVILTSSAEISRLLFLFSGVRFRIPKTGIIARFRIEVQCQYREFMTGTRTGSSKDSNGKFETTLLQKEVCMMGVFIHQDSGIFRLQT